MNEFIQGVKKLIRLSVSSSSCKELISHHFVLMTQKKQRQAENSTLLGSMYPPEVAEFVYITDDTYTKKQVLRMEHLVLKVLAFDLAAPTINQFLTQYFLHQQPANCKVESLAMVSSFHSVE